MFQTNVDKLEDKLQNTEPWFRRLIAHWPLPVAIGMLAFFFMVTISRGQARAFLPEPTKGYYWKANLTDEFEGTALNSALWATCYDWYSADYQGCTNSGNNELEWYTAQQVKIAAGHLTLTAEPKATQGWNGSYEQTYPYVSGMISTGRSKPDGSPKWSTQYGYYEARMRVDGGRGIWPAFWLLPVDRSWPPEIDIMELLGHAPNQVRMTHHWPDAYGQPQKDESIYEAKDFTKGWHVYSVQWQPGRITWYIDGKVRKSVTSKEVAAKPMELIINLAVGGTLPGEPDISTPFPAVAEVDYVRAYQMVKQ